MVDGLVATLLKPRALVSFLLFDSALSVCAGFLVVRESLFWASGASSSGRFVAWWVVFALALAGAAFFFHRARPGHTSWRIGLAWLLAELAASAAVFGAFPIFAYRHGDFSLPAAERSGVPWSWLVSDWSLKAGDLGSFIRAASAEWALLVAAQCVLVGLAFGYRRRGAAAALLTVGWIALARHSMRLAMGESATLFVILIVPAPVFAAAFLARGWPRASARAQGAALLGWFIALVYLGDFPVRLRAPRVDPQIVRRVYPCPDGAEGFPTRFARDLWVEAALDRVFVSYGPSSGLVSLRLSDGCIVDHLHVHGVIRKLWSAPGERFLYGADDNTATLFVMEKSPLRIARRVDLGALDGIPDAWRVVGDSTRRKLYVLHYTKPILTELDLDTLELQRSYDFRSRPGVRLPAAMLSMTIAGPPGHAFVGYGPIDVEGRWRIADFDLERFAVSHEADLQDGTIDIAPSLGRGAVWVGGGWGSDLVELDARTLEERRRVNGSRFTLALAAAPEHGFVAAAGAIALTLPIVCEESGGLAQALDLGPKIMAVRYVPDLDELWIASGLGIFRVSASAISCPHPTTRSARDSSLTGNVVPSAEKIQSAIG